MINLLKRKLNKSAVLLMLLPVLTAQAQNYRERAALAVPQSDGFYSIGISPALSAHIGIELNDVRIMDGKQQVPFIIRNVSAAVTERFRDTLHIVQKRAGDSGISYIVFENPAGNALNECTLLIGSADAERSAVITGSNDGQRWFSVSEYVSIAPRPSGVRYTYEQTLNLPKGNYRFYKVAIDNGKYAPLDILEVYGASAKTRGGLVPLQVNEPAAAFTQKDSSDHYSYITVRNSHRYHIEQFGLDLSGPKYYQRALEVITSEGTRDFELKPGVAAVFEVPVFNDSVWYLRIFNGDNPPLKIKTVRTAQASRQVVAYLEGGKQYELLMNAPGAVAPQYELQGFRDSIPELVPGLSFGGITTIPVAAAVAPNRAMTSKVWIWVALVVVLAALGFFTMRLVKDMKEEKKEL
jgi:hypothetical protein